MKLEKFLVKWQVTYNEIHEDFFTAECPLISSPFAVICTYNINSYVSCIGCTFGLHVRDET